MVEMEEKHLLERDKKWGWVFVAPYIVGLLVFFLIPVICSMYFSLTDYNMISAPKFIGLKNYIKVFTDPKILEAYRNTFVFLICYLPMEIFLSCVLAVLLNQKLKSIAVFRGIFFTPVIAPMVAVGAIWVMLYNPFGGIINQLFGVFGIEPRQFVFSKNWFEVIVSIAVLCIWKGIGSQAIYLLAALQSISNDIYEAALIDGAGPVRKFFSITIPLLSPTIFYLTVLGVIGTINSFEIFSIMTQEGAELPVIATYIYQNAFRKNRVGLASAIGWVTFVIVAILTWLQKVAEKRWVHYE
ncbi:MAG: sugar ABC transporter permease [Ruminococcaceae bacterium]|nr:sugar ABC transporter permease [Oscillospiraceae bacterium]